MNKKTTHTHTNVCRATYTGRNKSASWKKSKHGSQVRKKSWGEKKSGTAGSFSNLTEKPISYEKEEAMLKAVLMDAKEFQIHSKLSKSTIQRRIQDGSLKVWQPGGKGTRILIYADNLLKSRGMESMPPEIKNLNQNKKTSNTSPRWLK